MPADGVRRGAQRKERKKKRKEREALLWTLTLSVPKYTFRYNILYVL
jgi:hypothetical protein